MPAPCERGDGLIEVPRRRHLMHHIDLAHLGHWDPSFIDSMAVDPSQWGRWLCNLVPVRCADQDCFTEGVFEKLKTDVASQGMMFGKPGHLLAYAALSKGRAFQKTVICIDTDKTFDEQKNYFPGVLRTPYHQECLEEFWGHGYLKYLSAFWLYKKSTLPIKRPEGVFYLWSYTLG